MPVVLLFCSIYFFPCAFAAHAKRFANFVAMHHFTQHMVPRFLSLYSNIPKGSLLFAVYFGAHDLQCSLPYFHSW